MQCVKVFICRDLETLAKEIELYANNHNKEIKSIVYVGSASALVVLRNKEEIKKGGNSCENGKV